MILRFIAQEVQKVLPEVVYQDNNGDLSVAYGNMVGLIRAFTLLYHNRICNLPQKLIIYIFF